MVRSVKFAAPKLLQTRLQLWRSRFIFALVALCFVALGGKALYLQTMSAPFLQAQGAQRYEKTIDLQANRGRILDRHGVVLASSLPARSVWAYPDRIDLSDPRLMDLARLLDIKPLDLQRRLTNEDRNFVFLKRQVDLDTAERIRALRIKGVGQDGEYKRDYPQGEMVAHLVGFTDIGHVGQEGLELAFQSTLAGHVGSRRVIRDGTGQIIGALDQVREPRDGRDLRLTIDTRIQAAHLRRAEGGGEGHQGAGRRRGGARRQDRRSAGTGQLAVLQPQRSQRHVRRAVAQPRDHRPLRAWLDAESVHRRHGIGERQVPSRQHHRCARRQDEDRAGHHPRLASGARTDDAGAGHAAQLEHRHRQDRAVAAARGPLAPADGGGLRPVAEDRLPRRGRRPAAPLQEVEADRARHHLLRSRHLRVADADGAFLHHLRGQRRIAAGADLQHRGRTARPADAGVAAQP